jgi:hypothetical protein
MRVAGHLSRWDLISCHCVGRRVLDARCVGDGETGLSREIKVEAIRSKHLLQPLLTEVAREVVGVDLDSETIKLIHLQLGTGNSVEGFALAPTAPATRWIIPMGNRHLAPRY